MKDTFMKVPVFPPRLKLILMLDIAHLRKMNVLTSVMYM